MNIVKGDLFQDKDSILLHCVSADFAMGAGIALQFVNHFPGMKGRMIQHFDDYDIPPKDRVGSHYLHRHYDEAMERDRFIVNLITKERYNWKPTYMSLAKSLISARDDLIFMFRDPLFLSENPSPLKIAMPKIGCGLDQLDWNAVKAIIHTCFPEDQFEITIYEK